MIQKENFGDFLDSIKQCYGKDCSEKLPNTKDFPVTLFNENKLNLETLNIFSNQTENIYLKSVSKRIIAVVNIQTARDNDFELDLNSTWKLVTDSIKLIPSIDTISSIGSQGFLSIPLYKHNVPIEEFDFIRMHIWDPSLEKYINKEVCKNFSIHTHSFHAHSWIIFGKIINNRYLVNESKMPTGNSRFTINYNKTLNEVNQHTSTASNDKVDAEVRQISQELYMRNSEYQIKAGQYHSSGSLQENGLSATFFSFTAKGGLKDRSFVVGPNTFEQSEINRTMHIDPIELLNKLDREISSYE